MNTLIGETYMKFPTTKSKKRVRYGIYKCLYCDNTFEAQAYQVKIGHSTSCGCRVGFRDGNIPANKSKYDTGSNLYQKWESMKYRVTHEPSYIEKGIKICEEWLKDFGKFKLWSEANGYEQGLCIHRKDNGGDYTPDNCKYMDCGEHTKLHNLEKELK